MLGLDRKNAVNKKKQALPLTANAITVLEKRYLWRDAKGNIIETPQELFERVAIAIAQAEALRERKRWAEQFYQIMAAGCFLPNSPTLMNAGKKDGQLSACFVLPIEDSLDGIFETLKEAAIIHQSGGGTGFSFSRLRPKGAVVRSSHGVASGPVSYMRIYDASTEAIKQGGTRRGANMAILRVDHPDIFEFVDVKRDQVSLINFNTSVGMTNDFMGALEADGEFWLRDPTSGKSVRKIKARDLFNHIVQSAWECGDPGLIFLDQINFYNPTPNLGEIECTNPCGEQPLLPYESCNLGSLNLGKYFLDGSGVNWDLLKKDVHLAVRFLDDVIDVNKHPIRQCEKITLKNRKIGLGVMGFADLLLLMGIHYDSEEGRATGEKIMAFVDGEAKKASTLLATKKGAFPNWKGSRWYKLGYKPLRNATVSTVAPTGTISIIAGASSGIEPYFAEKFYRNVLAGEQLIEVTPVSVAGGRAWRTADKISVEDHIKMQAVFQKHCDSAVSKTINMPESATPAHINKAYRLAFKLGCKGITIYRDRSRPTQVLQRLPKASEGEECPRC